ncbi:MAG TPA: hypothetical protein VLF90_04795 [Patescibacteria group bacterium]|nr:hypothetical protein [Patescibacteria group bacterium]
MKRFKDKYRLVLSIIVLGLAGAVLATGHAAANGECNRIGSTSNDYDYGGYHYRIIQLGINGVIPPPPGGVVSAYYVANTPYYANNPNPHNDITKPNYFVINDSKSYISSTTCNGITGVSSTNDYGGSMIAGQPDEIDAGQGVFAWNDSSFGTIRPINMGLGLAPRPNGDPTASDGYLNGRQCLSSAPTLGFTVSLAQCNDYSGANVNRSSAVIDDSGRLVIEGNGITRTIWCTEMNTSSYYPHATPAGYKSCNPDIAGVNPPAGTGFMFRDDQTCKANLSSPDCTNPYWTLWYKGNGLPGQNSLTSFVNTDAAGYLQRMYVHYDARNTGTGGFGAQNYFTLKYPTNAGACIAFTVNGQSSGSALNVPANSILNVHADFKNTGTRPWRSSDGYSFFKGSGPAALAPNNPAPPFPGGILVTGQHATFNIQVTAPANGVSATISWRVQQNGGAVTTCSQVVTSRIDNFDQEPDTKTPTLNGAPDSPTSVNFDSGVLDTVTNGAPLIKISTLTPHYYYQKFNLATSTLGAPVDIAGTGSGTGISLNNGSTNITPGVRYDLPLNNVAVGGLSLVPGDQVCSYIRIAVGSGTIDAAGNRIATNDAFHDSTPMCTTISNLPYVSAYGGDVVAGANFAQTDGSCDPNTGQQQQIVTEYDTANKRGSGAQLRTQATGQITGFPSAFLKTNPSPGTFGTGLSTTNASTPASNVTSPNFGGNFDQAECIPDWYVDRTSLTPVPPLAGTATLDAATLDSLSSGTYYYSPTAADDGTGNFQIGGPVIPTLATIDNGKRITIYVNGDLSILGNIVYTNANTQIPNFGYWANLSDIPSLYIIAKGNIYIESEVTQLDGVYIAQQKNTDNNDDSTANGGWVYTCGSPNGYPYGINDGGHFEVYDSQGVAGNGRCSAHQLVVNGAVISQRLKLLRSGSSLRYGSSTENLATAPHACAFKATDGSQNTCAAEVFDLSPDVYLANPFTSNLGKLNAINDLPPIL